MKAAVLDLGLGNLLSIRRGLERAGAEVEMVCPPPKVGVAEVGRALNADAVVLPGVGAFGDGMRTIGAFGRLIDAVGEGGKPLLGICLGMQLLFEESQEGGFHRGLGLLKGRVLRLPGSVKVPHMGWNNVEKTKDSRLLAGIRDREFFYFVHSYYCQTPGETVVAECEYGISIPAVVEERNIFGTQFHPEKSGGAGVEVLKNFLGEVKR